MGGRLSTTRDDLNVRLAHWSEGLSRLHGVDQWLFGKGLGRFPVTALIESSQDGFPGSYRLAFRNGEGFLSLSGPRIKYLGFGELFRFSQRVDVQPNAQYRLVIEARTATPINLHVELCEKHLLYNAACAFADPAIPGGLDGWKEIVVTMGAETIRGSNWLLPRPVYFAMAVANPGAVIEIRRLRMIGPGGVDLLRNGDFAQRRAYWFSSSDKYHLPWHIKNIALDLVFDQGL